MYKILSALSHMQDSGIVHRDLKPENIMLQKNAENDNIEGVKIIDFGLSKIVLPDEHLQECCGTPAFAAPEILDKQKYGKQVDIWSIGCLLYTIVSG